VIELLLFFAFVKAGEIRFSETWTIVFELLRLQVTAEISGSQGCRITRALESRVVLTTLALMPCHTSIIIIIIIKGQFSHIRLCSVIFLK